MRHLLLLTLCFCSISVFGQSYCKDSLTQNDPYYQCSLSAGGDEYNPVCGCDNVTYRNSCAAYHWGGLLYWTDNTICGNFHFDFRPTGITYFPAKFQAYIRNISGLSIPIAIYIYDSFGKLQYTKFDVTSTDGFYPGFGQTLEIQAQLLPIGIYSMVVIINNEKQYVKFGKLIE